MAIAKDVHKTRDTVALGVATVAEQMVEFAQGRLMEDVFPLVTELWREALKAEIVKVKEKGKDVDWKLIDRLLKGMNILDRPLPNASHLQAQESGQLEGFDTLAGFVASRTPPPRIADRPTPQALPENVVDVESTPVEDEEKK